MTTALASDASVTASCFHCGESLLYEHGFEIEFEGETHANCCAGCQAVANTIIGQGLGAYYRQREQPASRAAPLPKALREQMALYDEATLQGHYVQTRGETCETTLLLEDVRCSACVWLAEQTLRRVPGVQAVSVNYSSQRAHVSWYGGQASLSGLLAALRKVGYGAQPFDAGQQETLYRRERMLALLRMLVAGLSMMQVMMYAWPAYFANRVELPVDQDTLLRWACLILTVPAATFCAWPFYKGAWRDLRAHRAGMDVPISLGILGAFLPSVWTTLRGGGSVYFDSVSMFVFLLLVGRFLEQAARRRATEGVDRLATLLPRFAHFLPGWPVQETRETPVARLAVGDRVLVKPGETIPVDGRIVAGSSEVNEALLSGESAPQAKGEGDEVIGGSVNVGQALVVRATEVGESTQVAGIVRLIDRALAEKPKLAELAERYAQGFVLAVLICAAATAAWWLHHDATRALAITVAVLVISCPCALALATPVALTAATGALARRNFLVARGHALPTLARVTHVMFDKTGTLTVGQPRVIAETVLANPLEASTLVRSLESQSEHVLAHALLAHVGDGPVHAITQLHNERGQGLQGTVQGTTYRIGKAAFVAELVGSPCPDENLVWLGCAGQWLTGYGIADSLRSDAVATVERLQHAGIRVLIASGDYAAAVQPIAQALQVDEARGDLRPGDKLAWLKSLQDAGAVVWMVGDGVNDAPVLAGATLSAAMGQGADVARQTADIVLLGEHLAPLAEGHALALRTRRVVIENLAWSVVYNLAAFPLAACGFVTPLLAGIGMASSSLLVVLNALRLARKVD